MGVCVYEGKRLVCSKDKKKGNMRQKKVRKKERERRGTRIVERKKGDVNELFVVVVAAVIYVIRRVLVQGSYLFELRPQTSFLFI